MSDAQVDEVWVQAPWPVEDVWMQLRADRFRPIVSAKRYRAYEVIGR